jgi:hypothetical protein
LLGRSQERLVAARAALPSYAEMLDAA